ncbi:MAG TPA: hypothetical protein PK878_18240 [bacterium]|nr:hypothetical protein [Candidatus Omnitrophota bacterium]HOJ62226.1 hypothetical protein [bacterium]HPP00598.1 hypothetical protein [bacterium]HXK96083.1 hypothetical protein [bacterium]
MPADLIPYGRLSTSLIQRTQTEARDRIDDPHAPGTVDTHAWPSSHSAAPGYRHPAMEIPQV